MRTKLIEFRKQRNYSVEEMANKIGVSTSFYEKIEYGDRNPSFNFITLFKEVFPESNVDDIFFNQYTNSVVIQEEGLNESNKDNN